MYIIIYAYLPSDMIIYAYVYYDFKFIFVLISNVSAMEGDQRNKTEAQS